MERGQRQSKAQFFSCVNVIDKAFTATGYWQREDITPGADLGFFNGRADDSNWPPNYTLIIYFKLSHVCPETWRFRKDEGCLACFCNPHFSIFSWDPGISVWFSTFYIFLVCCSTTQSTLPGSAPEHFPIPIFSCPMRWLRTGDSLRSTHTTPHPPALGKYCLKPDLSPVVSHY